MVKRKVSLEERVISNLQEKILEKVEVEFTATSRGRYSYMYTPDCLISKNGSHIAVVDAKADFDSLPRYQESYKRFTISNGYLFFIVATENEYKIYEGSSGTDGDFNSITLDDIITKLQNVIGIDKKAKDDFDYIEGLKKLIKESASKFGDDEKWRKDRIEKFSEGISSNDLIIVNGSLEFVDSKKEDDLFEQLFEKWENGHIYRYTSFSSLFRTLNDQNQSMCCLIGMNDKSEVNYADSYLEISSGKTEYDYRIENKYFILSCVEDDDDEKFTMWRLYGDNTRGVRLTYTPQPMPIGFRFMKIYYETAPGYHPGLEFIKLLTQTSIDSVKLHLKRLCYWKHFFKPYDYHIEKEVRLICEKGGAFNPQTIWIKGEEFSIAVPLVLIPLEYFPLHIEAVKLGLNMKERDVNKLQIKELCFERGIKASGGKDLDVDDSRISHYRI